MWMMPVGAMNAGDPPGAYAEATALGLAHNESFAVEAGGVMAACYAAAFGANATLAKVLDATKLAQDGTGEACQAAVAAVKAGGSVDEFVAACGPQSHPSINAPGTTPTTRRSIIPSLRRTSANRPGAGEHRGVAGSIGRVGVRCR